MDCLYNFLHEQGLTPGNLCLCFSLATESLANKMKDMQSGQSVDISSIMKVQNKKSTM